QCPGVAPESLSSRARKRGKKNALRERSRKSHAKPFRTGKSPGEGARLARDDGLRGELLLPGEARARQGRVQPGDGGGVSGRNTRAVLEDAPRPRRPLESGVEGP